MNQEHMRSIFMHTDASKKLLDELEKLPNWELRKDRGSSRFYLLGKNEITIHLRKCTDNVFQTSNVLPQDTIESHPTFHNDALQGLLSDLEECGIECVMDISESDKAKL